MRKKCSHNEARIFEAAQSASSHTERVFAHSASTLEVTVLIYIIDDEPIILKASEEVVRRAVPDADLKTFGSGDDAIEYMKISKEYPDTVFCDIEMPGISGLDFAIILKQQSPRSRIVFVTAYSEYALDAFRVHANGYILKPMTAMRVLDEIKESMEQKAGENDSELLRVQCFGNFEVFWKGKPLLFARRQTKELFAYLVDRKGASCTMGEIACALWEDCENKNSSTQLRILISDLRHTLANIGMEDLVIRRRGQVAIMADKLNCDYYRMLKGDMDAVNAYHGEYMVQYSWAEITAGQLAWENGRY